MHFQLTMGFSRCKLFVSQWTSVYLTKELRICKCRRNPLACSVKPESGLQISLMMVTIFSCKIVPLTWSRTTRESCYPSWHGYTECKQIFLKWCIWYINFSQTCLSSFFMTDQFHKFKSLFLRWHSELLNITISLNSSFLKIFTHNISIQYMSSLIWLLLV